jgi:hypothetical protein
MRARPAARIQTPAARRAVSDTISGVGQGTTPARVAQRGTPADAGDPVEVLKQPCA